MTFKQTVRTPGSALVPRRRTAGESGPAPAQGPLQHGQILPGQILPGMGSLHYSVSPLQRRIAGPTARAAPAPAAAAPHALPARLKHGVETLSGMSLDDVTVHYNSARPAQAQALAYAQGSEIHLAPGQQRHLPHEAWHIVQQRQGRVPVTLRDGGWAINDDARLENEADAMGSRALSVPFGSAARHAGVATDTAAPDATATVSQRVIQRKISFAKYEELFRKISFELPKQARDLEQKWHQESRESWSELSLEAQLRHAEPYRQQIRDLIAQIPILLNESISSENFHQILSKQAEGALKQLHASLDDIERPLAIKRVTDFSNLPRASRALIHSSSNDDDVLVRLGTDLPGLERWALLNEDIGQHDDHGSRFDILDRLAEVLRPIRERIKSVVPGSRLKYRGSLVRGLKGYPKGGIAVDPTAYDCDAFIEVPSEFWLNLRKSGARGIERDPGSGDATGHVEIRGYEPLNQISFKDRTKAGDYPAILDRLLKIETEAQGLITAAQKSGVLKGYKYEDVAGKQIDFQFFIRPVYNSEATYADGNPYLFGQIGKRGYPALERSLPPTTINEFAKKKDRPESSALLGPYVAKHGPVGVILPEYQVVIGKHGWHLETGEILQWRILKRELDKEKGKTRYSRSALPGYQKPLPDFERNSLSLEQRGPLVAADRDPLYDVIAQPEVIQQGVALTRMNAMMSSIKLFDGQTNILSLKDPEKIPIIEAEWWRLINNQELLDNKYPALAGSSIWDRWFEIFERVQKKLEEAVELRDVHGGSKKIVRDHSLERRNKKPSAQEVLGDGQQ